MAAHRQCCGCEAVGQPYRIPSGAFCDPALRGAIRVGHPVRRRSSPGGGLQVHVPIRNVSDRPVRLGAQIEFVDEQGHFYGDRSTRRVLSLEPGQVRWLDARSQKERARDFELRLCCDE